MNNVDYVNMSLNLHLFFDRIMKEHSFFLEAGFMGKDENYKKIARDFQNKFGEILNQVIILADGNVNNDVLRSNEIVTKDTLEAENITSELSGIPIDTDITLRELNLRSGFNINQDFVNNISNINRETLPVVENLIQFKNDILNKVLSCQMYTTNYPLLIDHIMDEAKMYLNLLNRVETRTSFSATEMYEQELFWNQIMMEHAEFIRGLLDQSEEKLMLTADQYAEEYKMILQNYRNTPEITNVSLKETLNFRDFKVTGEEGILNCQIKSIIIPLLADHVVREANHFIRILQTFKI